MKANNVKDVSYSPYIFPGIKDVKVKASYNDIVSYISLFFDVKFSEIKLKTRVIRICHPRFICCYFLYEYTDLTIEQIGLHLNIHHATVLHGIRFTKNMQETNDIMYCNSIKIINENLNKKYLKYGKV